MARMEEQITNVRQELAAAREGSDRSLADLRQVVARNEHDLRGVSRRLDHKRLDFEATKARAPELATDLEFKLDDTDPAYQRFSGYLSLIPDGHTLWVDRQSANRPIIFYRQVDGVRCELIVTRVTRDSVVGYLLLPALASDSAGAPIARCALYEPVGK